MKIAILCLIIAGVVVTLASPADVQSHSVVRREALDLYSNMKRLIEELIANLSKAGQQAKEAIDNFNKGVLEQARKSREKFASDLEQLKHKVSESITKIEQKFQDSGLGVRECMTSHRSAVEAVFAKTAEDAISCIDSRIQEAGDQIENINTLNQSGSQIISTAVAEMRNCTSQHSGNILIVGSCLGSTAIKTEVKGATYLMQSGLAIGRLNLFLATMPTALELCAGSSLVNAGMSTTKILMEIGSCSANSIVTNFSGNTYNIASDYAATIAPPAL